MFRLPTPKNHQHKLPEYKLHQLRLIIIGNHPNINNPQCPFCLKEQTDPDIHLILKCPKLRTHFLSYWSHSFFNLQQTAIQTTTEDEFPSYLLNIIHKYLNTTSTSNAQDEQFFNIILTADTYIDHNLLKFNLKFNTFTTLLQLLQPPGSIS